MSIIPSGLLYKFKTVLKNPLILFIYGIFAKWYISIFIAALVVTYWIFKGLHDIGIMQAAEDVIFRVFTETKSVARYCIPKIFHFDSFWDCLENPPSYEPTAEEKVLEHSLKDMVNPSNYNNIK